MWSRFAKSPILPGLIAGFILFRLLTQGLPWIGVAALVVAVLGFGFALIHWLVNRKDRSRTDAPDGDDVLISLVYLLEEPRDATDETVRRCVSSALKLDLKSDDQEATDFVIPATPPGLELETSIRQFIVKVPQGIFGVIVSSEPYIDNPRRYAYDSIRDKRLRTAIEKHRAWISVDRMGDPPVDSERSASYEIIGKILAAMAGPDCLALYCPELQRCNEFDPALIEVLAGGKPLDLFAEPTFEPVIEIPEDDPRMAEAVEDAKRRWPEFIQAFAERIDLEDERFIVKAEFTEQHQSEFMWVSVSQIEGDLVTGVLMNDPHELVGVHRGQNVTIRADQLNDWIYPLPDGDAAGGFTLKILANKETGEAEEPDD